MTAPRFAAQLNEQICHELAAHNQYLACAIHYDAQTMPQMAAFFYAQALEEREHLQALADHKIAIYGLGGEVPDEQDADGADTVRRGGAPS